MTSHDMLELLFDQLWQVTILCVVAGWISRTFLTERPALSYQLWLVVLLKCLTPPIWSSHCGVFSWCFHHASVSTTALCEQLFGSTVAIDRFILVLVGIWLGGSALSLLITCLKWSKVQKRIRAASMTSVEPIQQRVSELAAQLGIRRPVELIVTEERVGPAVIGMWRPLLVLPAEILDGKDIDDLEPILAHELLHIRRGDTLVAILETTVRVLWWFHPAVQRAADSTSQAGEFCCDGEVLGEFMYQPRRYADSLLDVLEAKCRLQPVVATPGIRKEQVTKERLRRIMVSNHTKPRALLRAGLMILAMLVFLPGRAIEPESSKARKAVPTVPHVARK